MIWPDVGAGDIALFFEQIAAIRVGDEQRTRAPCLRCARLAARSTPDAGARSAATWDEISARWSS